MTSQPHPTTVPDGYMLRALRTAVGMSLRSMATEIGVSHQHLARVETGERIATQDLVERAIVAAADVVTARAVA